MQTKISKSLEGAIARTAFDASKSAVNRSLKDYLMLELLRDEGSLAYQILASRLNGSDIQSLRASIEREAAAAAANDDNGPAPTPEEFFRDFSAELLRTGAGLRSISTAHALLNIASDCSTATSAVLAKYGLMPQDIAAEIARFAAGDDPIVAIMGSAAAAPAARNHASLEKFGTNLTRLAREGRIDPVIGREREIERVVQILSRRKKNNPILIGEAGVGKSAIVEGLALRIAAGEVPGTIADKELYSLDMSSLVAGTKFRGEFEERMQQLLEELRSADDTIIFIDEIHTIVGAGSTQGGLDTANILKPALARGEIRTIGATTLDEYRSIERDAALERRFRKVMVEPTTREQTLDILHNIAPGYERHHGVRYTDEALRACVSLTDRYITDRSFPDKAIDVMDEAGSRARMLSSNEPDDMRRMRAALAEAQRERREAAEAFVYERAAAARLRELSLKARIGEMGAARRDMMADNPAVVDVAQIEQVVTSMTGIPAERISGGELERLRGLGDYLASRVIGQDEAVRRVTAAIRRSRAGLKDENRPAGVFMFTGPTGTGKTLLAKELSKQLFDERDGLIRLDMSEYGEKHNVARLIGAPPGYVGYGEGGRLTEAVRRRPYSVVLFDEIEKAHPDVFNIMLQIFDEGRLTDGEGRSVDFRNTVIIMTSNVGSREAVRSEVRVGYSTSSKESVAMRAPADEYRKALESTFAPEFLNRVDDVIVFRTLSVDDIEHIVSLELESLLARAERIGCRVEVSPEALRTLARRGYESRYGVRSLRRTLVDEIEHPLSTLIIDGELQRGGTVRVESAEDGIMLRVA
ncbi:MAG: ATP-dependent Clp protease ATP-binding subunit [Alistipes sp.]|nr:ATP-dependent Clp protease ATP-binding subunit [Alistipes sp.]